MGIVAQLAGTQPQAHHGQACLSIECILVAMLADQLGGLCAWAECPRGDSCFRWLEITANVSRYGVLWQGLLCID